MAATQRASKAVKRLAEPAITQPQPRSRNALGPVVVESPFAVVKTRRAFEEICDQIEREIAAGRLRPGDRLPAERDLAEQFGVSRTAVREALRSLEMAGIVESRKGINDGPFIRDGDPGIITRAMRDMVFLGQISTESLTEARILITNDAIRLACERRRRPISTQSNGTWPFGTKLVRAGSDSRRSTNIVEFYRLLGRATHNEVLVMMVDSLSEIVRLLLERVAPQPRGDVAIVRRSILKQPASA